MARPFANWTWLWTVIDKIGEWTTLQEKYILPLLSVQWGWEKNPRNLRVAIGRDCTESLYYNGIFFCRFMLPFFVGFMFRWSGSTDKRAFLQTHVGWKLNGRFAIAFRIQSDYSGAVGMDFPNPGQARGWADGGK